MSKNGVVQLRPGLDIDERALAAFATRHGIQRLAVFGSILRADFHDGSDIDILVEFAPGRTPGLLGIAAMELELTDLVGGRNVDLRTYHDLSRYFRDEVLSTARELYAA